MNICFLIRSLDRGGAERQLTQLAIDLKARGHTVRVITYYPGGWFEGTLTKAGVPVESVDKRGRWHLIGFLNTLQRTLRRHRPDIVYSMLTTSNVVAAALSFRLLGARIVWGIRVSDMELAEYGAIDRAVSTLEKFMARIPRAIVVNSEAGQHICLARGFRKDRLHHIPNGIDLALFSPDPEKRENFRVALGIGPATPLIGMLTRDDPMKGVDIFLDAAKRLSGTDGNVRFLLAGTGMDRENSALVQEIGNRGLQDRIFLLGARGDVPIVLSGLDVATLSSRFGEGFSNAIGEAMASGLPVVATDVGDTASIVGKDGWIVPPGDSQALSDAWKKVLSLSPETRAETGLAARRAILERFERKAIARRAENLLASIAAR